MVVFYHIFPAFAIPFSKIFEKSPKNFCCPPSTFAAHTSKARVPFIDFLAYPLYLSNNNPAIYPVPIILLSAMWTPLLIVTLCPISLKIFWAFFLIVLAHIAQSEVIFFESNLFTPKTIRIFNYLCNFVHEEVKLCHRFFCFAKTANFS